MLLAQNSDAAICMPQQKFRFNRPGKIFPVFSCPVLVSLCPLQPQLSVGWPKWIPTWSSAVVAHPTLGLTLCAVWYAFLLTAIVKSGYRSYRSLSVISKHSGHSPLTSLKAFSSAELTVTGCYLFLHIVSKLSRLLCIKIPGNQQSAVTEILKPAHLAPTIMPRSKWLRSHFFPILMVDVNINWSSWPISAWHCELHCCHIIGWLDNQMNKYVYCEASPGHVRAVWTSQSRHETRVRYSQQKRIYFK